MFIYVFLALSSPLPLHPGLCEPEVYCIIIAIEIVVVRCMLMCSCIQEGSRIEGIFKLDLFSKYFLTFRSASACILFCGVKMFSGT